MPCCLLLCMATYLDIALFLVSRSGDPRVASRDNENALTHFGVILYSRLSPEEQQAAQNQILAAWQAGRHPDARWLRPIAREIAAAKLEQEQADKQVALPGIPRRTKQENWNYLLKEVFGHDGIVRCVTDRM